MGADMSRLKAAFIHLLISGLIVISLLTLMFGVWYPDQYFKLMGGDGLIYLIVGIDLCLGPFLTFVVFKSGKKSLKFDLAMIALMQIAALSYGSYMMFNARPVFVAYADGAFSVATALELKEDELNKAPQEKWRTRSITGPKLVAIQKPTKKDELSDIEFLSAGMGYARFPKLFVEYDSKKTDIINSAKPLSELRRFNKNNNAPIDSLLSDTKQKETDFVYLPINSFFGDMAVILNAKTAEFIAIIDATPPPPQK